jgi:hypothetical protein
MTVQAMFRRGGILQGPRLIASILAVLIFLLYFSAPVAREIDTSNWPVPYKSSSTNLESSEVAAEHVQKDRDSESLSDKFYDFVGGKGKGKPNPSITSAAVAPKATSSLGLSEDALKDPFCEVLADATHDLLVIVNTPASDLYTQLPSRFLTNLRCAPTVLFSTIEHSIGSYKVIDALASVPKKIREKHIEFELYRKIQSAQRAFQEFSVFKQDADHNLDKWSVVPSIIQSYKLHPDKKWFVYIEGNTYLSLPNVLSWIGQLDSRKPFYAGAQTTADDVELASASGGIILSNAAVAALVNIWDEKKSMWEEMTADKCCGDIVLAEMLKQIGITLHRSFPNMQTESPLGVEWTSRHWCKAAVTWHKMTPPLMDMLWEFERNWTLTHHQANKEAAAKAAAATATSSTTRGWLGKRAEPTDAASSTDEDENSPSSPSATAVPKKIDFTASIGIPPILYKDYFEGFIVPLVSDTNNRTDWDNLSNSFTITDSTRTSSYAHSSADTCRAACDIRTKCVQWAHEPNTCRLGTLVRIGEPVDTQHRTKSGWLPHRVKKVAKSLGTCPSKAVSKNDKSDKSTGDEIDSGAFFMPGFETSKAPKEEEALAVKEQQESAKGIEEEGVPTSPSEAESEEAEEAPAEEEEEEEEQPAEEEEADEEEAEEE